MSLQRIVLGLLLAEVATKCFVKGLQCYVCEDCSEYEGFKELHICGEIPNETLMKPTTALEVVTKVPTKKPSVESSSKPSVKPAIDDYSYEDSGENYAEANPQNSVAMKTTKTTSITRSTTPKPVTAAENSVTKSSTSTSEKSITRLLRTTQSLSTSSQKRTTKLYSSESKNTTTTIATKTTTKPKPVIPDDYDDYVEYEDPMKKEERSETSFLKINEPVCYMIKYYANNTVLTNRGCTTFINANKYLTCQSLYNGSPMESCRICSANGCNKFLNDDGDEDNHGIYIDAAGAPKYFSVFMLILWVLFSREIV